MYHICVCVCTLSVWTVQNMLYVIRKLVQFKCILSISDTNIVMFVFRLYILNALSRICIGHIGPTGKKYYNVLSFCQWCHILLRWWRWATGTTPRISVVFWTHGMPTTTLFLTYHRGTIGGPSSPTEWVQSAAFPDLHTFSHVQRLKITLPLLNAPLGKKINLPLGFC